MFSIFFPIMSHHKLIFYTLIDFDNTCTENNKNMKGKCFANQIGLTQREKTQEKKKQD